MEPEDPPKPPAELDDPRLVATLSGADTVWQRFMTFSDWKTFQPTPDRLCPMIDLVPRPPRGQSRLGWFVTTLGYPSLLGPGWDIEREPVEAICSRIRNALRSDWKTNVMDLITPFVQKHMEHLKACYLARIEAQRLAHIALLLGSIPLDVKDSPPPRKGAPRRKAKNVQDIQFIGVQEKGRFLFALRPGSHSKRLVLPFQWVSSSPDTLDYEDEKLSLSLTIPPQTSANLQEQYVLHLQAWLLSFPLVLLQLLAMYIV